MVGHPLRRRIRDVLDLRPAGPAVEYEGEWLSWGDIAALACRIESLDVANRQVGILLRNTPAHIAALLGVLIGGGTVVVINPSRGDVPQSEPTSTPFTCRSSSAPATTWRHW